MATKSASTSLRACLSLPQDFSLYVKWQKKYAPGSEIGQVCDALEYYRFIRYRDALINRSLPSSAPSPLHSPLPRKSHIASECGRAHHPFDPVLAKLCPVCEVTSDLSFLYALTVTWEKADGPRLRPGPHVWSKSYAAIRSGWRTERLQFQEFLDMLDALFEYEKDWKLKHPFEVEAVRSTNSASAALNLALEESRYPALLTPAPAPTKKPKLFAKIGKVTFAPKVQTKHDDRISASEVKFIHDRPRYTCSRSSSAYEPGSHACPPDSEFLNSSGTKAEPGDIKNLKIFVTDDEDAFDNLQDEPQLFRDSVVEYQGLVGMHVLKDNVFDFLVGYMRQNRLAKEDLECLIDVADRMIVLVDEEMGGVVDVFLFDGSDENEEEEDDQRPEDKGKGGGNGNWTCLKECLSF